jgi:hypothetical protein
MNCIRFALLCRIPVAGLRLRLSRWHVSRCPRCRQASDSGEPLPPVLVAADRLPADLDLRPAVRARIAATAGVRRMLRPSRGWWGYAAAAAALLVTAGIWILAFRWRALPPGPAAAPPASKVRLLSAKVADRPARVFQVQSRDPDRSIFWIARNKQRS